MVTRSPVIEAVFNQPFIYSSFSSNTVLSFRSSLVLCLNSVQFSVVQSSSLSCKVHFILLKHCLNSDSFPFHPRTLCYFGGRAAPEKRGKQPSDEGFEFDLDEVLHRLPTRFEPLTSLKLDYASGPEAIANESAKDIEELDNFPFNNPSSQPKSQAINVSPTSHNPFDFSDPAEVPEVVPPTADDLFNNMFDLADEDMVPEVLKATEKSLKHAQLFINSEECLI
ncbi:hypothetical protein C8J56DRAFT_1050965 [Mycena floridula]|nr:hypothetical protein C8J56DRAFT_1050965 [Mycena floridula]